MSKDKTKDVAVVSDDALAGLQNFVADQKGYIEPLNVTYQTSDAFKKRQADLGDFFFNGESLGTEILVVPLRYCYQINAVEGPQKNFKGCIKFPEDQSKYVSSDKFNKWSTEQANKGFNLINGISIFLYIPSINSFAAFFCKNKLLQGGANIAACLGARMACTVKTRHEKSKTGSNEWYELDVTRETLPDLSGITDVVYEKYKLFMKESDGFGGGDAPTGNKTNRER